MFYSTFVLYMCNVCSILCNICCVQCVSFQHATEVNLPMGSSAGCSANQSLLALFSKVSKKRGHLGHRVMLTFARRQCPIRRRLAWRRHRLLGTLSGGAGGGGSAQMSLCEAVSIHRLG